MKSQPAKAMSDSEVLEELRSVAKEVGRNAITVDEFNSCSIIGADTIRSRFGSWRAGLEMAGLRSVHNGERYSDEECFENLLTVWTHYGRPPQYLEMKLLPSTVGPKAYVVRWKTWNRALHAFVERVNGRSDDEPSGKTATPANAIQTRQTEVIREEDIQKIKLGLRYKVLLRDQFKCVLCGSSPATNPVCRLHVDHAIPWSKGGKTVEGNLRTLCECCNLGKSDRVAVQRNTEFL
ncbi:MAG: homing endonuclease associated repeat-containing protein [Fimbriimonadales bacterium]